MTKLALDITGMTCAACSSRVEKVLSRVDGVTRADVNLPLERASLEIDGDVDAAKLIAAVERAGYGATLRPDDRAAQRKADEAREAARRAAERQTLLPFASSALLSIPLVLGILPMTFYRWYARLQASGPEALEDKPSRPRRVWNKIPEEVREQIDELALDEPELSPR